MPGAPTQLTFLFTDIAGSVRLWQQDEQSMRESMVRHDRIVSERIGRHDGRIVKHRGDGHFAVFEHASDAVAAALDIQSGLLAEEWPAATPIRLKIAANTGEAEFRDGDYFGPAVNRCARLQAIAHAGQVLLSGATERLCRAALPEGSWLRDLGLHRLSDLDDPEHVFQLVHGSLPVEFPPLESPDAFPNNLPADLTAFVGRTAEISEVRELLAANRQVTLTGTGGCGKTRLALRVARDLVRAFSHGIWLVELAAVSDAALVPHAVAGALSLHEQQGRPIAQVLREHCAKRCLLLVLDNCEHLVEACAALVTDLLRAGPEVHVLATSREILGVPGEHVYRVPSLACPHEESPVSVEYLEGIDAVQLFLLRARAVDPDIRMSEETAPTIAGICRRLQGIPLAIELAAARTRSLSLGQIAERLASSLSLLDAGSRAVSSRQRTISGAIDWSHVLLGPAERTLFRRFVVFEGGASLEAVEAVCSGTDVEAERVVDVLEALCDKSMLISRHVSGGVSRYCQLDALREYGYAKLREAGEEEAVRLRHCEYYAGFADEAGRGLQQADPHVWLDRVAEELPNVRSALEFAISSAKPDLAARLCAGVWRYWRTRGRYSEGRLFLERVLAMTTEERGERRRDLLHGAAAMAFRQGDYGRARELWTECYVECRELGDTLTAITSLGNLGITAAIVHDWEAAESYYREALDLSREAGDRRAEATTLCNLGTMALKRAELASARELLEASLDAMQEINYRAGVSHVLASLGQLELLLGETAGARDRLGKALAVARELQDMGEISRALGGLGRVALAEGDHERARDLCEQSLAIRRATGDRRGCAAALVNLGTVQVACRELDAARESYVEAARLHQSLGDAGGLCDCLDGFALTTALPWGAERAIVILSAASAQREAAGLPREASAELACTDQLEAALRALGDAVAAGMAIERGRAMTMDEALAYALA